MQHTDMFNCTAASFLALLWVVGCLVMLIYYTRELIKTALQSKYPRQLVLTRRNFRFCYTEGGCGRRCGRGLV